MKAEKQHEVYLTEDEFCEALRDYVQSKGVAIAGYPKGPVVYHENEGWCLHFHTESEQVIVIDDTVGD